MTNILLATLYLTLILAVQGQMVANPCPLNCFCSNKTVATVECMSLMEFPMTFPRDTQVIKLSQMNVRDIPPHAFAYMPKLEIIEFDNCNIQNIQGCSFSDMPSIKEIRLNKNVIGNVERYAFRGLRNLKKLEFNNCRIGRVKSFAFYDIKDFETMTFYTTHIQNLYNAAFYNVSEISRIIVSRSNFSDIVTGAFQHMRDIRNMEVHMNDFWNMQCQVMEDLMASTNNLIFVQNGFYCNCSVYYFLNTIGRIKFQPMIEKNRCHGPEEFRNKSTLWHVAPSKLKCDGRYKSDTDWPCTRTTLIPYPECPKLVDGVFENQGQNDDDNNNGDGSSGFRLRYDISLLISGFITLVLVRNI